MEYDLVISNARIMSMNPQDPFVERGTIAINNGVLTRIEFKPTALKARRYLDAEDQLITPGFIDCHTHLVYAGNRAHEFSQRLQGLSYAEIAQAGGGILATVKATREVSYETLLQITEQRARIMFEHGTTTIEIKSGYGLDLATEVKILKVAQALQSQNLTIIPTFLGAHAIPPEFKGNAEGYLDHLIDEVLPEMAAHQLAIFVDGFCESIAFTPTQIERLFKAAKQYGFKLKLHAEQLTDQKGAILAAQYGATSVDHLEFLAPEDCKILAKNDTVAVLLPGAFYFLKETKLPPIAALRAHQVPMAIATDSNPGTSPFLTLPLMMNMACVLFGLTMTEVFQAVTLHAAKALALDHELGSITVGKRADLVWWSCQNPEDIVYNPSMNYCSKIIKSGVVC